MQVTQAMHVDKQSRYTAATGVSALLYAAKDMSMLGYCSISDILVRQSCTYKCTCIPVQYYVYTGQVTLSFQSANSLSYCSPY